MTEKKVPLVLFSGGLDSTYLLWMTLRDSRQVDVLIVEKTFCDDQNNREAAARAAIFEELNKLRKEDGQDYELGRIRNIRKVPFTGNQSGNMQLGQATMWPSAAVSSVVKDTSDVRIGYVLGDTAQFTFHCVEKLWPLLLETSMSINKDIPIIAPMRYWSKQSIMAAYPATLLPLVTWCESRYNEQDCGFCSSCERMIVDTAGWKALNPETYKHSPIRKRVQAMMNKRKVRSTVLTPSELKDN